MLQHSLYLSTDSKFCMQLGTLISMPTTRTPFIRRLYFIYQSTGQIISFQMMPPLRSFDDVDERKRGQKKTDDLRAMTTLGPRTLCLFTSCFFVVVFFNVSYKKSKTFRDTGKYLDPQRRIQNLWIQNFWKRGSYV